MNMLELRNGIRWIVLKEPAYHFDRDYPDRELNKQIWSLYQSLKRAYPGFPFGYCKSIAPLKELGFKFVDEGYFKLDKRFANTSHRLWGHSFCEDNYGRIIDFTVSQFNPSLYPWNRTPDGLIVVEPDNSFRQRYGHGIPAQLYWI